MLTLWSKTRHIPGPGQEWLVCIHTHVRTPSLSSSPSTLIFPALLSSYLSFPSWPVSYLTLHSLPLSYPPTSLTSSSISLSLFFLIPHSTSPSSYLNFLLFMYFPSLSFLFLPFLPPLPFLPMQSLPLPLFSHSSLFSRSPPSFLTLLPLFSHSSLFSHSPPSFLTLLLLFSLSSLFSHFTMVGAISKKVAIPCYSLHRFCL